MTCQCSSQPQQRAKIPTKYEIIYERKAHNLSQCRQRTTVISDMFKNWENIEHAGGRTDTQTDLIITVLRSTDENEVLQTVDHRRELRINSGPIFTASVYRGVSDETRRQNEKLRRRRRQLEDHLRRHVI